MVKVKSTYLMDTGCFTIVYSSMLGIYSCNSRMDSVVPNEFIAPCGALSLVHQRRTLFTRLATVLGPLIEALIGEIDLGALKNDCL